MRSPRPVMIAVTTPLLVIAGGLAALVALGGLDATNTLCPGGWTVAAVGLPFSMLAAAVWTLVAAVRHRLRSWAVGAATVTLGLVLWFVAVSDLVTNVDTEPDAAPRSEQCR